MRDTSTDLNNQTFTNFFYYSSVYMHLRSIIRIKIQDISTKIFIIKFKCFRYHLSKYCWLFVRNKPYDGIANILHVKYHLANIKDNLL